MNKQEIEVLQTQMYNLDDEYQKVVDAAVAVDETILYNRQRFSEVGRDIRNKIGELNRTIRLNQEPEFLELSDCGDVMPISEFISHVQSGSFIDYDGHGRYVRDGKETQIEIYPSDVKHNSIRSDFDTIIWFNR